MTNALSLSSCPAKSKVCKVMTYIENVFGKDCRSSFLNKETLDGSRLCMLLFEVVFEYSRSHLRCRHPLTLGIRQGRQQMPSGICLMTKSRGILKLRPSPSCTLMAEVCFSSSKQPNQLPVYHSCLPYLFLSLLNMLSAPCQPKRYSSLYWEG